MIPRDRAIFYVSMVFLIIGILYCLTIPSWGRETKVTHVADASFVRVNMVAIEATMLTIGYGQADGYGALYAPRVEFVDWLPFDDWGAYEPQTVCDGSVLPCTASGPIIKISERQPAACMIITLSHELGHDAAVRMKIVASVPNDQLMARLETISTQVERSFGSFDYRPNCFKARLRR